MHHCTIEDVYPSGMVDAQSNRGGYFERIKLIHNGIEGSYSIGDKVIVLSDGAQNFAFGIAPDPKPAEGGRKTLHRFEDDIVNWNEAKTIAVDDPYGAQSRLIVSPGGGLILDTGQWCSVHYDPGHEKITEYFEQRESIGAAHHAVMSHDGSSAEARYEWRTKVDDDALDRSLRGDGEDPTKNKKGHTLSVDITDAGPVTEIKLHKQGDEKLSIGFEKDGSITVNTKNDIDVQAEGDITVETQGGGGDQVTVRNQNGDILVDADGGGDVKLGDETPLQSVVLDQKIRTYINQQVAFYNAHVHQYIFPLVPLPGPPVPTTPPLPVRTPPVDISSPNVKANAKPNPKPGP